MIRSLHNMTFHLRKYAVPAFFFIVAATFSLFLAQHAFQWFLTSDECSYLFQANNFLDGLIARPFPPFHESFDYFMIILREDVGWLSRYPFGHSLFLVPGVFIGSAHIMVFLAAGLTVVVVYRSGVLLGGHALGATAGSLLLFSPYFLFYHGTLLSHTSGLLVTSLMLLAYISWRRTDAVIFAALSGLAWGYLFNTRTFTAFLIAIPFALDSLIHLYQKQNKHLFIGTILFAFSSFLGVIAMLIYNTITVGDPWTMTYLFHNPTDKLGFGTRYYGRIEHTLAGGLENIAVNLKLLNVWLWGFWGSLLVALLAFAIGWTERWSWLFAAVLASIVFGHIFFWYPGPQDTGPGYYLETLPFLILGASFGVRKFIAKAKTWYIILCMAIFVSVVSIFNVVNATKFRETTMETRKLLDVLQEAPKNSIVFIDPEDHPSVFGRRHEIIFNPRGLDSDVILARSLGEQNKVIMHFFDSRVPFRLMGGDFPRLAALEPSQEYHLVFPAHKMFRQAGTNVALASGEIIRIARQEEHNPGLLAFGRFFYVYPGKYDVEFDIQVSDCESGEKIATVDVAMNGGKKILSETEIYGEASASGKAIVRIAVDTYARIEPRAYYHACGSMVIQNVHVRERRNIDSKELPPR